MGGQSLEGVCIVVAVTTRKHMDELMLWGSACQQPNDPDTDGMQEE